LETYEVLWREPGWWNGNRPYTLTTQKFLAHLWSFEIGSAINNEDVNEKLLTKIAAGNFYYYADTKWILDENGKGVAPPISDQLVLWYIGARRLLILGAKDHSIDLQTKNGLEKWENASRFVKEGDGIFFEKALSYSENKRWWPKVVGEDLPMEWGNQSLYSGEVQTFMDNNWKGKIPGYMTNSLVAKVPGGDPWYAFTYCQYIYFTKMGSHPNPYWTICNNKEIN
jgi:hypothetical protein